jgi:hypothetical protein
MSEALIQKLAQLEAEVSAMRKAARETPAPQFNLDAFRQAFVSDPVGTMTKMGAPVDHITRVLVANAMGDQAPPELKVLASMGPQVNAQHALNSQVEALSRQISTLTEASTKDARRKSFQTLTSDKSKYPNLSKAASADPTLLEEFESYGGTAEDFATRMENRLKLVAPPAPPASEANADDKPDQSTQVTPAGTPNDGGVPPIPKKTAGVFTQEDHAKLRDEIVRKALSQSPQ